METTTIGFRVWGSGIRVWGLGFRIQSLGFRAFRVGFFQELRASCEGLYEGSERKYLSLLKHKLEHVWELACT